MHATLRVLMIVMGIALLAVSYAIMRRLADDDAAITDIHQDATRTGHDLTLLLIGNAALLVGFITYTGAAVFGRHDLFVFGEAILLVYLGVPVLVMVEWWRRIR